MKNGFKVVLRDEQTVEIEADHFSMNETAVTFYLNGGIVAFFSHATFSFAVRFQDKP